MGNRPSFSALSRPVKVWLSLGLILWSLAAALTMWDVRSRMFDARDELEQIRGAGDEPSLAYITTAIGDLDADLQEAASKSSSPVLLPLKYVPWFGAQLRSVEALSSFGASVTGPGREIADLTSEDGALDLDSLSSTLDAVDVQLASIEEALIQSDLGPSKNLAPDLAEARQEAEGQIPEALEGIHTARSVVRGIAHVANGATYLVLGANNAEMRLGAGMVLSVGEAKIEGGEVSLPGLHPSQVLFPVPETEIVDPGIAEHWGFLNPSNDYRKLTYSARFADYTGPQALQMWEAQTGRRVDGVIMVDPFVVDAMLAVIGPVEIEGDVVESGEALRYLLQDQYSRFGAKPEGVETRRDYLSTLARALMEELPNRSWEPAALVDRLLPLVRGRHVLAYSRDSLEQAAWAALDMDGALTGSETGVYLLNLGASKLDPFMEMAVEVYNTEQSGRQIVRYDVTVTNSVRDAEALDPYVLGPWEAIGLDEPGTYRGRIAAYAPGSSSNLAFVPERSLEVLGHDGPVAVIVSQLVLAPGESVRLALEYELPAGTHDLIVEPSARYPAIDWTYGQYAVNDAERFTLSLR